MSATPRDPRTIIDATLARFDDLAVTMRSLELDVDEDLKGASFGLVTFISGLENVELYVTVAQNTGGLSENLQRRFAEVLVELHVTMSRMNTELLPLFDQEALKATIAEVDEDWLLALDTAHAYAAVKRTATFLDDFYKGLPEIDKRDELVVTAARRHVAAAFLGLEVLREDLVHVETNPLGLI